MKHLPHPNDPYALQAQEQGMQIVADLCDRIGIPKVFPEPETLRADLSRIRCKSLAYVIAHLIAEHEPMLHAEADGATVTVRVVGEPEAMRFTVNAMREIRKQEKANDAGL